MSSTEKQAEGWLKKAGKPGLPRKLKAWLDQHGLRPTLMGGRVFPAQSAWKLLTSVGLAGSERKKAVQRLGEGQGEPPVGFKKQSFGLHIIIYHI